MSCRCVSRVRAEWSLAVSVASAFAMLASLGGGTAPCAAAEPVTGEIRTPDDLTATLFAAEPLLSSPSDIDIDARGRVWVCEVMNYRGKKETRSAGDRILVLEDTDSDGKADKQTVFYQGRDVDSALGICVIGEGPGRKVIVSCAPDVFIFHDDDGDLVADRKESLFTKTGQPQHDHSVHAFVVGPDGRWYFNFGNTGQAVHDKEGKPVVDQFGNVVNNSGKPYREGMVFRCKPDGSDFEVLAHNFRNNYEVAVDSFGTLWQSDNDDDGNKSVRIKWVMEYGNYGYKDELTGAGWQSPRTNIEPETQKRHWHQNDPGVVPNMLLTGAGSPCGMCVYEGSLLPERFRGSLLHCEPGVNVMRAYHVRPAEAGYSATAEPIADGAADRWFRPSDVCVAPDGSAIVADWYDPGVGGHAMGDTEKGRIYRIAPKGSKWSVPAVDFGTVAGCVAALASPNLCTRATALEQLAKQPKDAVAALTKAFELAADPRHKARLAWAAGMLPGQSEAWVARLATSPDEAFRIIALRMCRLTKGDVVGLVEKLAADPSVAVRRECAIALKGKAGDRADRAWAGLALKHKAGDRWELEALGIGADCLWDARLAAWLAKIGDQWKTPVAREIVWRSRAAASAAMICGLIGDAATTTSESLALIRAIDFQDRARAAEAVPLLVKTIGGPDEKRRVILPELVMHLEPVAAADPVLTTRIEEAAGYAAGTQKFVDIVQRFAFKDRIGDLVKIACAEGTAEQLASAAVGAAIDSDMGRDAGAAAVHAVLAGADPAATGRLVTAIGIRGSGRTTALLKGILADADAASEIKAAAVRAMARSQQGAKDLVAMAKAGELSGVLPQVAAMAIASCPWGDIRQAAADVLPMPNAKGGAKLPPVADMLKRKGNPEVGKAVFLGAGTCGKCHVVNGEGKGVGPNLSGVGAKLSREALYESILAPSAGISHSYETWTALLEDGRSVTGMLVSQSPEQIVIKGADAIDVTILAGEVEQLIKQPVSLMPADLASTLSAEELVDVVTWMETLRATQ